MRSSLLLLPKALGGLACVVAIGCGGKIAPGYELDGGSSSGDDGGASGDATLDGAYSDGAYSGDVNGGRGLAPTPTCIGKNSACIYDHDAGTWTGAAIVKCDPVHFQGPWTLLLQRSINGNFRTVQVQKIDEPGFGAVFNDENSPVAQVTYQVCVVDEVGTRCGSSFTTSGPPNCACVPYTCRDALVCNTTILDLCGHTEKCGACANGLTCSGGGCCPPGLETDGNGICVCAPPGPCQVGEFWNVAICACEGAGL